MPAPTKSITTRDVRHFVDERVFSDHSGSRDARRVGIELEWITRPAGGRALPRPADLARLLPDPLPGMSRLTFEPGGQLELSGPPLAAVGQSISAMAADVAVAREALRAHDVVLVGLGLDPEGMRERVVDGSRYRAMERYFDTRWPDGRTMMRNTASVQVNVDLGPPASIDSRWEHAHDLVPVLAAAFANSPFAADGNRSGWRSTRLAVWSRIDPRRTRSAAHSGTSAASAWTRYALEAPVMMIRADDDRYVPAVRPIPFARWIHEGHELGWPTLDDFDYHLTTLFPPVRPRGWFELRVLDALPDEWWPVAVAITTALFDDADAADVASHVAQELRTRWVDAARRSCADPVIGLAVQRCFTAALDALPRLRLDPDIVRRAEDYYERYAARGRCPADDLDHDPSALPATT